MSILEVNGSACRLRITLTHKGRILHFGWMPLAFIPTAKNPRLLGAN